jgi:transposase InsO family protein
MDNVFIERLWRGLKYECVYLHAFETGSALRAGLTRWIRYYNSRRPFGAVQPDARRGPCDRRWRNGFWCNLNCRSARVLNVPVLLRCQYRVPDSGRTSIFEA